MKKLNIGRMTRLAILAAILILMAFTPLGYLKIGPFSMTLLMIPVAVGAVVLGPGAGLFLGTVFGLTSLAQCFGIDPTGTFLMNTNPVGMTVLALVPRMLMGLLCGLIFKLFDRPEKPVLRTSGTFVASLSSALLNTILFMSALVIFVLHNEAVFPLPDYGFGTVITAIVTMVGLQGVLEAVITTVVGGAVSTALLRYDKGVRK
ncbi:MAG: ECF transporter S component [Clostridia bacterium]|nr:ECF transporter S component [Clostridia bacterium]